MTSGALAAFRAGNLYHSIFRFIVHNHIGFHFNVFWRWSIATRIKSRTRMKTQLWTNSYAAVLTKKVMKTYEMIAFVTTAVFLGSNPFFPGITRWRTFAIIFQGR